MAYNNFVIHLRALLIVIRLVDGFSYGVACTNPTLAVGENLDNRLYNARVGG